MLINEIEVPKTSMSFRCLRLANHDLNEVFDAIANRSDLFELEAEVPGFQDFEFSEEVVRGHYYVVYPFEIEHLVDNLTTKTLFKRIESCEFIITEHSALVFGKSGPIKLMISALEYAMGSEVGPLEFDFEEMNRFQNRLLNIKAIVVSNPKEKEIRRARLSGHMENYTEYNIIDPRNHNIDSISGLVETPLGKMTVTVSNKGTLRLSVKKGMILTTQCIEYIIKLLTEE